MKSGFGPVLSFFILLLLGCSTAFAQGAKVSPENPAESERDRPQERAKWFMRGRMVDGKPGAAQLHRAYDQKLNNRRLQALERARAAHETSGETTSTPRPLFVTAPPNSPPWNFLGPAPTATAAFGSNQQNYGPAVGRVTAVAVDQGDTSGNTVYIGGASGGLWRTTNAVSTPSTCDSVTGVCTANVGWTPLTDGQATLTVGSIALSHANSDCGAASPTNCLILVGTGEANNSADSYYGLGILRSIDGGANWSLLSSACPSSNPTCGANDPLRISFHGLGFTHIAFSTDNVAPHTTSTVVASAAAASGGINVGAETGGSNARGIYYSTDAGITWTRAAVSDGATSPDPGSANAVIYNSAEKKFYANLRYHGFYSSSDGASWTRLANQPAGITLTNCPSSVASPNVCPLYRAEMAVVPGRDEMYVWIYDVNENDIGIYQTKNGGQTAWTQISTTSIDNCGDIIGGCGDEQGTYNIALAAVPNGTSATDLYAGGVNQYKCAINPVSNPTCAGTPFLNLTHVYGCQPIANIAHVHPDEHGIDFLGNDGTGAFFAAHPTFSPPVFFGNDGGVYRVSQSSSLTNGSCPASGSTPPSPFDNLNSSTGFSMIQFVGFSQAASDATTLVGGTQDNGSPAVSGASPSFGNWLSANNGDGGFNAINPLNPNDWFTSNPAPLTLGAGIQRCQTGITCTNQTFLSAITQDKIGGDNSSFYTFFTLDPQASGRMLVASCRVWRGDSDGLGTDWSSGGGSPLSQNFDTGTTGIGATCGSTTPFFVNTIAAGGPCNGTCDPGAVPGTNSGGGSQVVWAGMEGIADATSAAAQCPNHLPCGGQVWVTTQADADLATTPNKWTEVSGLTSNPSTACTSTPSACNINPKHYTISGIALDPNDATGKTAYVTVMGFGVGHIFKTTDAGATWAMLDGIPSGTGLPDAPADAVVADPSVANLIYVGTDVGVFKSIGDGTWTELGPSSGAGSLPNVTVTQLKIYNNPGDSIPLRLRASTYGRGIWEIPISSAAGFQLSVTPTSATAVAGQTTTLNGTITLFNGYNSQIALSCQAIGGGSLPTKCTPNPATLAAGATTFTVTVGDLTANTFNFKIVAVGGDPNLVTQQFPVSFSSVNPVAGNSWGISPGGSLSPPPFRPGQSPVGTVTVTPSSYTGTVSLTCTVTDGAGNPVPGTTCAVSSLTPFVASSTPQSANVTVTTTTCVTSPCALPTTPATNQVLTVTAQDGTTTKTATFNYVVVDYALPAPAAPAPVLANGSMTSFTFTLTGLNGYGNQVTAQCGVPSPLTCSLAPASPYALSATATSVTATITAPSCTSCGGNKTATITTSEVGFPALAHSQTVNIAVQDFSPPAICNANVVGQCSTSATVTAGGKATFNISLAALGGFSGMVTFDPASLGGCTNLPALTTCTFAPVSVAPGGASTLTISTTAPSVSQFRLPATRRTVPLYALWLIVPGIVVGIIAGVAPRNRRGKLLSYIGLVGMLGILLTLASCGGSGGGTTTPPPVPKPGTPAGTYQIMVTGTSGSGATSLSHNTMITLTVQ